MFGTANNKLLLGLAALFSFSAQANNFNYNALEIRMGSSPSTFGGEFTTYFTENTHFVGRFDSGFSGDWDLAGGIGFNGPAGQFADIYGQMLLHNIKYESSSKLGDEFKTEINIGARAWLMEGIEVNIRGGQLMDNDGTNSIFGVGGRFHSTEQLSLGVDIRNNGVYGQQIIMSARFGF